jgi:hypothetical protein
MMVAQPAAPEKVNCWDTLLSTIQLVLNDEQLNLLSQQK